MERGLVTALSLGEDGVWYVLYAAIRSESETPFMTAFCETAVRLLRAPRGHSPGAQGLAGTHLGNEGRTAQPSAPR